MMMHATSITPTAVGVGSKIANGHSAHEEFLLARNGEPIKILPAIGSTTKANSISIRSTPTPVNNWSLDLLERAFID
jgi:hypothetical protein